MDATSVTRFCSFEGTPLNELFKEYVEAGPKSALAEAAPTVCRYRGAKVRYRPRSGAASRGKVLDMTQVVELLCKQEGIVEDYRRVSAATRRKWEKLYALYRKLPKEPYFKQVIVDAHKKALGDVKRLLQMLSRIGLVQYHGIDPASLKPLYRKNIKADNEILAALFSLDA